MLNADSPVPLYHQLAELLAGQIRGGDIPEGHRIESEHALSARYGVGRPTVRQATEVLVRRRMIERRRGAGTFVLPRPRRVDLFSLAGTSSAFRDSGLEVTATLLQPPRRVEVPVAPAADAVAFDMENPFCGGPAITLTRLSSLDGRPVLLEKLYLHATLFDGLREMDLRGRSLSQVVEEKFFLKPLRADQRFRVVTVTGSDARHLGLDREAVATPLLLVKRRLDFRVADGAIYAELYCRTDRLAFSQIIEGGSDA